MLRRIVSALMIDLSRLDLERRLAAIPARAAVRGAFYNLIHHSLERRGLGSALSVQPELAEPRRSYKLYPARDWVLAFATGGALLDSNPLEGMATIFGDGPRYFVNTWFGEVLRRFIQPDPLPALRWIERSREHLCNFGHWRIETRGENRLILHMFEEYMWLEAHRGGCEGLLDMCGVKGTVRATQDGLFQGRLEIEWAPVPALRSLG